MRDHSKLTAFHLADALALSVYGATARFPRAETFGLTSQMRRAAVSVPSNIVEGCARTSQSDYVRFLELAYGSSKEPEYQASLVYRLGFLDDNAYQGLQAECLRTVKTLNALVNSLRDPHRRSQRPKPKAQRPA